MSFKNFKKVTRPDEATIELIQRTGSLDFNVAMAAQNEFAQAIQTPIREGVLVGDIVRNIYENRPMPPGVEIEFPLDMLAPGEENEFTAYTNPGNGRIPERTAEADYVKVSTYAIANSIDWLLRHAREARWDIIGRYLQICEAGFIKKINDDGWHTILAAAADRNLIIFDADATAGQFTKRLVSLTGLAMRRAGGGNTASIKRGKLTDIFMSPEGIEDIRNWGLDQIDEITRREIYQAADGSINRVFQKNLHDLDELGENQEYQLYFTNNLGGSLNSGDVELAVGLDMSANDSFLMPIKQEVVMFNDPMLHRQQRAGVYGWGEFGFAVLDGRRVILMSY